MSWRWSNACAPRVAIINHGRIIAEGAIAQLRAKAEADGDFSLEDIFLKLVEAHVGDVR